uniref:Secreted protein n=1 Tax=Mesocestoides corti TaxID=53468 RepID=A0A5K3FRS8_MESCO
MTQQSLTIEMWVINLLWAWRVDSNYAGATALNLALLPYLDTHEDEGDRMVRDTADYQGAQLRCCHYDYCGVCSCVFIAQMRCIVCQTCRHRDLEGG